MAAMVLTHGLADTTQIGSLFTLFLHAPVKAFAFISDTTEMSAEVWNKCVVQIQGIERTIADIFEKETSGLGMVCGLW